MLSIKALQPGDRGGYYLNSLPDGPADYYLTGGPAGTWLGAGSVRLGLEGPVEEESFRRVLAGAHPDSGDPLVSGRAAGPGRVPGFDLTFSAPKSVTLLAVLSEPEVGDAVRAAHRQAVADTVALVETEVARARRGDGGSRQLPVEVVAASFEHHTSRAVDPQLHSHVVVANLGWATDQRWSALYGRRLYGWAKTAGTVYQAALRAHLTESLGVAWEPVHHGVAEVAGFTRAQLEAFSSRRAEIRAELERVGQTSARAAQLAAWATRSPKTEVPEHLPADRWHDRARQLGIDEQLLGRLIGPPHLAGLEPSTGQVLNALFGPDGLTAHASTFDRRHVLQAIAAAHPDGVAVHSLAVCAYRLLTDDRTARLAEPTRLGDLRYSTTELLTVERRLLEVARGPEQNGRAIAIPDAVSAALAARPTLSVEQRHMVEQLTTSGAAMEVVVGRAGAGKTFALDAAREAWESSGHRVIGAALAARAAAELQAGAGIPSTTLDRLLLDAEAPGPAGGLPYRGVVVVDEAGMVGTRKLARLLTLAQRSRTKCVLVGDMRQLPEVEAGGAFAALAGTVPTIELVENRRQAEPWERQALAELRAGDVTVAVTTYTDHGRITLAGDAERARQQLVDDWWTARIDGEDCAIYALRRADVDDLNTRARQHLADAGLLQGNPFTVAGKEFAVGDEVLALRNDRRLGVRNGTRATITSIDHDSRSIQALANDGATLRLPADYLEAGQLSHGYATTIHKAQGATVGRAFVLGSDTLYREAGYVGLSRARARTDLYLVAPVGQKHTVEPELDPLSRLAADLKRSQAQQLASVDTPQTAAVEKHSASGTLAELEAERDRLKWRLGRPPRLITGDDSHQLEASAIAVEAAEERLAGVDRRPRRDRFVASKFAEADLVAARQWHDRAAAGRQEQEEARQITDRWLTTNAAPLGRHQELQQAIAKRHANLEAAALADPAPHLVDTLGPCPTNGPDREQWARSARTIAAYRDRWQITDPDRALGPEPASSEQTRQRRAAEVAIAQTRHVLDQTRHLDTTLEI